MPRALVTGATGFVGSHLVDGLLARGYAVSCAVRPSSDTRWLKGSGAQLVPCDIASVEEISKGLLNVSVVFHVAGAIAAPSLADFLAVNEGMTRNVLTACARQETPPRLVYVSSLAAAGPGTPENPRTEEMTAEPVSDYGRSKLAGEAVVRQFEARVAATIARPPVVYGPRDRATLTLFKLARSRLRPSPGRGRYLSVVYVDDLVTGLIAAAESDAAVGRTYFLTHSQPLTAAELANRLADTVGGGHGWGLPLPDVLIKLGAVVSDRGARVFGRQATLTRDKARELTQRGWVCSGSKALAELGFEATTAHDDGLAATTAWYQAEGWL